MKLWHKESSRYRGWKIKKVVDTVPLLEIRRAKRVKVHVLIPNFENMKKKKTDSYFDRLVQEVNCRGTKVPAYNAETERKRKKERT